MRYILIFIFVYVGIAKGQTITVSKDGKGDYSSIQKAIESFKPSSKGKFKKIFIRNGIYNEKLWIDIARHHLILEGESEKGVIVTFSQARDIWRCENPNDYGAATINVMATDVVFKNLTVLNDYGFISKGDSIIVCLNEAGKVNPSIIQNYALPREPGERDGEKIVRKDGHQFAFRSMPGATRLKFLHCTFRSGGGDTVSPWDVEHGMYYFNHCTIEGHVDLYCPRGNALIENTLFICHSKSAAIWHDGSAHENDKTVLKNCKFTGDSGFKLGRYHREAQMYLFDCLFSEQMADAPIYQAGDRKLSWGHRIFYKNCHRESGDFAWHQNNTLLKSKDLNFKTIFGEKW